MRRRFVYLVLALALGGALAGSGGVVGSAAHSTIGHVKHEGYCDGGHCDA